MKHQRGHTMIELIVYAFLAVLAGVMMIALFNATNSNRQATSSSYLVSGATESAIDWIRRDLNETALSSVQVYPSAGDSSEAPGLSLVSARAFDTNNEMQVNPWGAPLWTKHVFYSLVSEPGAHTGKLVRWEQEIASPNHLPPLASLMPSALMNETRRRVLLHNVLAPSVTLENAGPGALSSDEFGGFRVQFVRRQGGSGGQESLTTENPRLGDPNDNTRLMEVELKLLHEGRRYPDYYQIKFRAAAFH